MNNHKWLSLMGDCLIKEGEIFLSKETVYEDNCGRQDQVKEMHLFNEKWKKKYNGVSNEMTVSKKKIMEEKRVKQEEWSEFRKRREKLKIWWYIWLRNKKKRKSYFKYMCG